MKKVVVIGCGPAGISAAFELLKKSQDYEVVILEESNEIGGISRTVKHNGNRMDIGGHRFFSKDKTVTKWWTDLMPIQGQPSFDDLTLGRISKLVDFGPDPEIENSVMLVRNRVSRIYYQTKFFDYPISMKWQTVKNLGLWQTGKAGLSYMLSKVNKLDETSLENFYINRFGKVLYELFFEGYTEKLWGRHPRDISAEWGAQRIKGLSVTAILRDMLSKVFSRSRTSNASQETSLIEEFYYPKYGPGQLWETAAFEVEKMGGVILKQCKVTNIIADDDRRVRSVIYENNGERTTLDVDIVISSMPLKDLVEGMVNVPADITEIAVGLPYRDFVTVGLLVEKINLKNETTIKTLGNIVPDCWMYIQDTEIKLGRIQIFNNWSPYMVENPESTVWIGLEYFCQEGDDFWDMTDEECIAFAVNELSQIGVISNKSDVLDSHREKVKKAYPAYFDTYKDIAKLKSFLDLHDNLYCVGRNGQHRYNNMDHSMVTSFETVKSILEGTSSREPIWNVNTEQEYHESGDEIIEKPESRRDLLIPISIAFMLQAIILVVYYIVFLSKGFLHSDSTDTILWAQAAFESKTILNPEFSYACLLPFGGHLLMLPFIGVFGVSMMTQTLGMLIFLVIFVVSIADLLRTLRWNIKWSTLTIAVLLLTLSLSEKLREIFWGHIIYYSLGILFLFVGLSLTLKILQSDGDENLSNRSGFIFLHVLMFTWFALCSTNGIQALIIFAFPVIGAVLLERFLAYDIKLLDRKNYATYMMVMVMVLGVIAGYAGGKWIAGDLVTGYSNAYSSYSDSNAWVENFSRFLPHWTSLLGVEVHKYDRFLSIGGILNLVRIVVSFILLIVPAFLLIQYKNISDRSVRILTLTHWIMTALLMFGYVFGLLSAASWRLSPIVCTSTLLTLVCLKWLSEQTYHKRTAIALLLPILFVCLLSVVLMRTIEPDNNQNKELHLLEEFLASKDLDYGYASFWNANVLTLLTDSRIRSRGVTINEEGIVPYHYQSFPSWYENQEGQETYFLLLTKDEYDVIITNDITFSQVKRTQYEFNDYVIMVFEENLF